MNLSPGTTTPTRKPKFSDHIMPHRIVNHTLWLIVEGGVLLVLKKILTPVWGTVAYATGAFTVTYFMMGIIGGAFCSLCEAVRLHRDQTIHKEFLDAFHETQLDFKSECRYLFRCDEIWNDTAIFAFLSLFVLIGKQILTWLSLMTDEYYQTLSEVQQIFVPLAITYFFVWIFAIVGYCVSHLCFSVMVHKKWIDSRIHHSEDNTPIERKPFI